MRVCPRQVEAVHHVSAISDLQKIFFLFTPALDSPISVAFKSNDFILCQMYREGALTLDAVRQLRHDDRKLTYTRQQADKSIICRKEVITKEQFIDLIQDATVQILF